MVQIYFVMLKAFCVKQVNNVQDACSRDVLHVP